jgi:hypothetical protein
MAAGDKIPGKVMCHEPGCMLVLDITERELFAEQNDQTNGMVVNGH